MKHKELYLTVYNLLITQDVWQTHYQTNNPAEGIHKLNLVMDMIMTNVKLKDSNTKIVNAALDI